MNRHLVSDPAPARAQRGFLRVIILLVAALAIGWPAVAAAQGGHAAAPTPRGLHRRVLEADAAGVVRVVELRPGRLILQVERPLMGDLSGQIEAKRSGTRPPPLAAGDRALVFLTGVRSPYLLVDEAHETIRLVDDESSARWSGAVASLIAAKDAPEALLALYAQWIDEGPETLRELGVRGLADPRGPIQPLPDSLLLDRAAAALDPMRSAAASRASALLAIRSPAATGWLLDRIPASAGHGASAESLTLLVLQAGTLHERAELGPALVRALEHDSPAIRRGAIQMLESTRRPLATAVRESLVSWLDTEPDAALRGRVAAVLARNGGS